MQKIAIISDIHGNLEALTTVLNDIKKRNIKTIYCLGDIIGKGANSKTCLKLIKENCQIIIKGNCDEYYSSTIDIETLSEKSQQRVLWNKNQLTEQDQIYLSSLPFCHEFYMSGSLIRLFHSTPNKLNDFVGNFDTIERKKSLFNPSENTISQNVADIVIHGHIHTQCLDRLYNRTIINVGSVGNPIDTIRNEEFDANSKQTTKANYLIVEGSINDKTYNQSLSFQFVNIPYDIAKELNTNEIYEKDLYAIELKEGKYRDTDKLKKSFSIRNIDMDSF